MGKLKELVYHRSNNRCDILADTIYRGVRYICVNRGWHPCCYVFCTKDFLDRHVEGCDYIPGIIVHGGVTYTGKVNKLTGLEEWGEEYCFGWDYGHVGDWEGYNTEESNIASENRKYTTDMLINECENVIEQYQEMLKQDEENQKHPIGDDIVKEVINIKSEPTPLSPDYLKALGFHSIYSGISDNDDSSMLLHGQGEKGKWKIFICFPSPSRSYAFNENPRKKFEGGIKTIEDLKMVVTLCRIPLNL